MTLYLSSLILIGVWGRLKRKEESLSDFYLAGRGMGFFVLFLTLYATQYSGNTIVGYAGKAYREGYTVLVTVAFMMSVIGGYLLFAPKLYRISKKLNFITVGDYIQHRYKSRVLTIIAVSLLILALGNFILTNLKAIGHIVEATTGGQISFAYGVLALSLIMVIYETLGGLRSVAWTDVIQGIILLLGCALIFIAIEYQYGGLTSTAEYFITERPDAWSPPTWEEKRLWLSTLLIVMFGISIYPQAIQRIYAAKNEKTLKRSLQFMVFMPLVTTFFIVVIGIVGSAQIPGLGRDGSEQITLVLLSDIAKNIPGIEYVIILFVTAAVAAIMSTVDSALLAISSLFTQDLYRVGRPYSSERHLTFMGKLFSWIIMGIMAYLAIHLPQTIWRLMEIKLEILSQVAPVILLGINIKSLHKRAVLSGLLVGTGVAFGIMVANWEGLIGSARPWGFHAGLWGLLANLITIGIVSLIINSTESKLISEK
ncbi:MAG: sodium/pantothenate symporter [Thermodesulfobacteriota bacterium]|nr:MAG: sodium/pantothenate symporter [Thermodesulfobacteriota bacterium]